MNDKIQKFYNIIDEIVSNYSAIYCYNKEDKLHMVIDGVGEFDLKIYPDSIKLYNEGEEYNAT